MASVGRGATPNRHVRRVIAFALLAALAIAARASPVVAVDDAGRELRLEQPPTRIVTLAPSLTELVFAAGGGARDRRRRLEQRLSRRRRGRSRGSATSRGSTSSGCSP